jgi:hypothetical protein
MFGPKPPEEAGGTGLADRWLPPAANDNHKPINSIDIVGGQFPARTCWRFSNHACKLDAGTE